MSAHAPRNRPRYRELPDGDAVGVHGADDVLGSLNLLSPDAVLAATRLVRAGSVYNLNRPVDWLDPPLYGRRTVTHHVVTSPGGNLDDYLDSFYLQASSQWDGFLHVADPLLGRYNRRVESELGIESWAERGIAGRGVLLDLATFMADRGEELPWRSQVPITVDAIESCRLAQGVAASPGDILLLHFGWGARYQSASADERRAVAKAGKWPGLDGSEGMAEYLWDWGVGAVASDNPSLEVAPPSMSSFLHPRLLSRLGIPIGELWRLDALAEDCAEDQRYDMLVVSAPINLPGGVGSPANALALR